ncbi:MAG: preprotein translocase subunit SecG [Cytophagaceae bacterium]|nr:preprotein translocase subunit SecG [Cytophagaceae bacterium]MBK9511383.1 preprotein translocase subunit SecG [Cytophagaceae bacterium]MBK9932671.1 preprotein translocase subunit SecG [Cytophagaceae bacterium]MBL0303638.1 preprotein translocase subunit SecG [Cytophagaceae bacterium]MBL0326468.1 preprotein translocase subunit SecG [Cytophagaceae bacterium]
MITTILILMIIAAILLIVVILIQNPKGGGLSSEFGGGTSQMFGVQKTGDILEKLTWGFFAFLLVAALGTGILARLNSSAQATESDVNVERSTTAPSLPAPTTAPITAPATTPTPAK